MLALACGERQKRVHYETSRFFDFFFFSFFLKAGRSRSTNGTRACIHAEIMEIGDGDDSRGEAQRTSGNDGEGRKEGIGRNSGDLGDLGRMWEQPPGFSSRRCCRFFFLACITREGILRKLLEKQTRERKRRNK